MRMTLLRIVLAGLATMSAPSTPGDAADRRERHDASEQVVFGPRTFAAQPRPRTEIFSLPSDAEGPFVLRIRNGDRSGRFQVEAAWIRLNGALVAGPGECGRGRGPIEREVVLTAENRLEVEARGGRGDFVEVAILGRSPSSAPVGLEPNPLVLASRARGRLTVRLAPPPRAPGRLALESTDPQVARVPASADFRPGQTEVSVRVRGGRPGDATVTARLHDREASAVVRVTPRPPRIVALEPPAAELAAGATFELRLRLSSSTAEDVVVALSSSDGSVASVPATVTVPAGESGAPVPVRGMAAGKARVRARLGTSRAHSHVTVTAAVPTVVSLVPTVSTVTQGTRTTLELTLSAAQGTDTSAAIAAAPPGLVLVPSAVMVPAGALSAPVAVEGIGVGQAGITASLNGSTASALVNVVAPPLEIVALEPESATANVGATVGFVVRINAARADLVEVALESSAPQVVGVPRSVPIAPGETSAGFVGSALSRGDALVTAALNGSARSSSVRVLPVPARLVSLVPSPLPLQEGATGILTVTIDVAQEDDAVIALANSSPSAAAVSEEVTVPAGSLSVPIPVTALAEGRTLVTATLNGTSAASEVVVTPPPPVVTSVLPSTLALAKGIPGVLRVVVSRGPSAPIPVALESSAPAVASVPAEVVIPPGALFADFPVASLSVGEAFVTASLNGGAAGATVRVSDPEPVALEIVPVGPSAVVGDSVPFAAKATLTDGTTEIVTTRATWSSSEPSVASIDGGGRASALAPGETTIRARLEFAGASGQPSAVEATTSLAVSAPAALALSSPSTDLRVGESASVLVSAVPAAPAVGLTIALSGSGAGTASFPASVSLPAGSSSTSFNLVATGAGPLNLTATAVDYRTALLALTIREATGLAVDSLEPTQGKVGATVRLRGRGFDPAAGRNQVAFPGAQGTVVATVLSATSTTLDVRVPPLAETGAIAVTNTQGAAYSPTFTVVRDQDFQLVASPALPRLYQGTSASVQVQLSSTGTSSFDGLVGLSVQGLPPGVTGSFLPAAALSRTQTVVLELQATGSAAPGDYPLVLRGRATEGGQALTRTALLQLSVAAANGQTGIKGRFVTPDGEGIAGVIVRVDDGSPTQSQTSTDAAGDFVLVGVPAGEVTLRFDATPANPLYPIWPFTVTLPPGQITTFPDWTINPPPSADRFTPIANATQTQVITDPRFPGLEIRLPAGVSIIGWDGVPKTRIAVEKVDLTSLPVPPPPTPTGATYQMYFGTPMGGIPTAPIPVTLPNDVNAEPGETIDVWFFDGSPMGGSGEWKIAGPGVVQPDGRTIRMPDGTGVPRFCGVCGLMSCGRTPDGPGSSPGGAAGGSSGPGAGGSGGGSTSGGPPCKGQCCGGGGGGTGGGAAGSAGGGGPSRAVAGNPVDLFTGQEMPDLGGLTCGGLTPFETGMSYHPVDAFNGISGTVASLGFGWVLDFDIAFLPFDGPQKRLILPGNNKVNFVDAGGTGVYRPFDDPRFDGAEIRAAGQGANEWELTFRDRRKWRFKPFPGIPGLIRGGPPTFLTEEIDPQGNVLTVNRQADGKILSIEGALRGATLSYGANGLAAEIRDSENRAIRFTYNADNRVETVTDPDGRVTRYTYVGDDEFATPAVCGDQPSFGKRIKTILYPGRPNPTQNFYGPGRRVLRQISYDGLEHRFAYRLTGACVTNVANPGVRCDGPLCPDIDSWENFQAGWRIHGGVVVATTVTRPNGRTATYEHSARGMTTAYADPLGRRTTYKLDPGNRIVETTDVLGRTWTFEYDTKGNVRRETDPLGGEVEFTYDAAWNRLTSWTRRDENGQPQTWSLAYDPVKGTITSAANPLGETTRFDYTARGELERITTPLDQVVTLQYDAPGDLRSIVDPLQNAVRMAFDRVGRQIAASDALGFQSKVEYSGADNVISLTDARGKITRLDYDPAGRLAKVTNARGVEIAAYAYDANDRLASRSDALGRATQFTYDTSGRLESRTDRRGLVTTYEYDDQDRLTAVARPEGVTRFSYDAVDRLVEVSDPSGSIRYAYDALDRVVSETVVTDRLSTEVAYSYDALGRLASRTVTGPATDTTQYTYDIANRLRTISFRGRTTTYEYDRGGRLQTKTLPNGIRQNLTYDDSDRLLSIIYRDPADAVISSITYTYDANGRRTSRAGPETLADTPFTAVFDEADRLTQLSLTATGQDYILTYDEEGNLASRTNVLNPTDSTTYAWDSRNRLVGIAGPSLSATFAYDALGRRIAKTINGERIDFVYDGLQAILEVGDGEPSALLTGLALDEVIARYPSQGERVYLSDALGSILALTRSDRSLLNTYAYSPYGLTVEQGPGEGSAIQYTARERDGTALYYYRARYYDPVIGRFTGEDPLHLAGGDANLYAYVGGSPSNAVDPLGLRYRTPVGPWRGQHRPPPRRGSLQPGFRAREERRELWGDFIEGSMNLYKKYPLGECRVNEPDRPVDTLPDPPLAWEDMRFDRDQLNREIERSRRCAEHGCILPAP